MSAGKRWDDDAALESDGYFDLGSYSWEVTTKSDAAQIWFDRGLIWSYAFNHEESARCFQSASREDPDCCMAWWGIAHALGPNYNKPWEAFDAEEKEATLQQARDALVQAEAKASSGKASAVEVALIRAAQARYFGTDDSRQDSSKWNTEYSEAMRKVYQEFQGHLDVASLFAESLMNLTPWALWDLRTGEPAPGSRVLEAKAVLDHALALPNGNRHPGLLHLWIHLMEMSRDAGAALPMANQLRNLVPDAGHLQHMPTHLDILCGDWESAIVSNSRAIEADNRYLVRAGALNFYSLYRSHNYHFKVYAAMFAGKYQAAIDTVAQIEDSLPESLLRIESPPMADWLESFLTMRVHVLVRFGKWEEIQNLSLPSDQILYAVTTAMMHYGKGVAAAARGNVPEAEAEGQRFRNAKEKVPASRTLFNNTARDILLVASAMLEGELEYRKKNFDIAFEALHKAVNLSDNLPYDEPWGWMQPPRHALGALLLEQGKAGEAAAVYEADLGLNDTLPRALQHPKNVWAVHGYHECLKKLKRNKEATKVKDELEALALNADVPVTSSCYCRTESAKL